MHAHIVVFIDQEANYSMQGPSNIDKVISDGTPSDTLPQLQELVLKHMIHYTCTENPTARCPREGRCSKRFLKPFLSETESLESDNYVSYRRRSPEEVGEVDFRTGKMRVSEK